MAESRNFDWETIYGELEVERMGWYWPDLDPDLKSAINVLKIRSGSFLDIGTGPGTQADALRKMGFEVLARGPARGPAGREVGGRVLPPQEGSNTLTEGSTN